MVLPFDVMVLETVRLGFGLEKAPQPPLTTVFPSPNRSRLKPKRGSTEVLLSAESVPANWAAGRGLVGSFSRVMRTPPVRFRRWSRKPLYWACTKPASREEL